MDATKSDIKPKAAPAPLREARGVVIGHNVTDAAKTKEAAGYVSSLTVLLDAGSVKVSFMRHDPPPIGAAVVLEYRQESAKGLPVRAHVKSVGDAPSPDDLTKAFEGLRLAAPKAPVKELPLPPVVELAAKGLSLKPGDKVRVAGSKEGVFYTLTCARKDGRVYCSCPAWRFQKAAAPVRECKHTRAAAAGQA